MALTACPPAEPCTVWGDLSQPAALAITQRMPDGGAEDFTGTLMLQLPPQGGHVAFVGVRLANFEGCRVELSASVFEPDGGPLATEEKRRVDVTLDGMSDPIDPADFANVPVCPNFGARDYVGPEWTLVVEAKQRDGRAVSRRAPLRFSCDAGSPACDCECARDFAFGKCGGSDAG